LGIRFENSADGLVVYRPDGQWFLTFIELSQQAEQARHQADTERRAREEAQRRADRLTARLRERGVDPDA
jgi:hypothetical protein